MDGSNSAGNPSAASSHLLPAPANEETPQTAEEDQQSTESRPEGPAETLRTEEEPYSHDPSTRKQKPENDPAPSSGKSSATKSDRLPTKQIQLGDSSATEKQKIKESSSSKVLPKPDQPSAAKQDPLNQHPLCKYQKKPADPLVKHEQKPDYSQVHQTQKGKTKAARPQPSINLTDFISSFDKQNQKDLELHISESKDQQNHPHPSPSPVNQQNQQDPPAPPPPPVDQPNQDPPPHPLDQQNQDPPTPPPPVDQPNQDPPAPPPPVDQPNQDPPAPPPPPVDQRNQDPPAPPPPVDQLNQDPPIPPPPVDQLNQGPPAPPPPVDQQNKDHPAPPPPVDQPNQDPPAPPPPVDQQNHQDPPLLLTPPEDRQDHQDPPAPIVDQKNHLCPSRGLIVNPTEPQMLVPPITIEAFCDQVRPSPDISSSAEPKLCGFLQKQGGPLRAWKQRWFTYEEKKNQLFYYRTPQDVMPLGRVELSGATFTYPLKAERGTFHIKTPERTFTLQMQVRVKCPAQGHHGMCTGGSWDRTANFWVGRRTTPEPQPQPVGLEAVTQELMLYWLQQLQVKRWQHRQKCTCPDPTNHSTEDDFLPVLKSPLGLVGEEAANAPSQRTPLANVSIKHPLIELQNSVHSLRKRSSQDWRQSVFHVEVPPSMSPRTSDTNTTSTAPRTPVEYPAPLPPDPAGHMFTGGESLHPLDGQSRKTKNRSPLITPILRRDTVSSSSNRMSLLQQEKQMLIEEVKGQKELVWILHKALESSQLEKRTCAEFLAAEDEQKRLELLRHRERQAADLRSRLEEAESETEVMRRSLAQRDTQLMELQENIRRLTDKNAAKQEVIIKLSDQLTACLSAPLCSSLPSGGGRDSQAFRQFQQEKENLKDDIEAHKTQNKFLNSEIYQLTKLWRNSSEQEKNLMVKVGPNTWCSPGVLQVFSRCSPGVLLVFSWCSLGVLQVFSRSSPGVLPVFSWCSLGVLRVFSKCSPGLLKVFSRGSPGVLPVFSGCSPTVLQVFSRCSPGVLQCAYLEASNCQMESRYLDVLRKLQETKSLNHVQRGAVQKMIEDALKGELKTVMTLNTARDHDEYGFKIIPDYEVEDMKLLAKIQALEIRSHNLLHQEVVERPLLGRWAQYLAGRSDEDLCPSPELKVLLRGGVPQEYRQRVWRWMIRARTRTIRCHRPRHYQQLCEKSHTSPHPASRQIQLDLHRTLTTNQNFSSPSSPALQQLRRILLAFSWQNPAIGYCQGLNRLAAIALLVLQNEEDAFWCLVAVVEAIMPQDYYTQNLVASQADQRVLKDFLAEKLPRLASHFDEHGVDVSLISFNWFLVVFVESLPSDILLPLWDVFLYEGTKVIFRYALALFKYKEDDILKIHDSVEIYQYLRFFTKTVSDSRRLTSIAFSDMNPFPGRLLRNRRMFHLEHLQAELQELEEQQRQFVTESVERKDKELDAAMSEDDDDL
ncbi:TBC1 domain family member 2A isoform X2 [Scophthalmus maximus]|uniref:TBC1 domain family member 2A isoform X2 n=1 Tax=Scophthalmus maximus TaxID=52904 RepID=UPI001FA8C622|nr:TBC1 domain family member 2A isoform X2 [Scophthalmus maximus]